MPYRYFKRLIFTGHRFYCTYIIFVIIQHLCDRIDADKIRIPVHKAMNKKNLWIVTKSTKHIKIINTILTLYYYNIFRSSFGYEISKRKLLPLYEPELSTSFRKYEIISKRHLMQQNKLQLVLDPVFH